MLMTGTQLSLNLDFTRPAKIVDPNKKLAIISFRGSPDLKEFLETFAAKLGATSSELCNKYLIEGLQKDLGMMLLIQANGDKTLSSLLERR